MVLFIPAVLTAMHPVCVFEQQLPGWRLLSELFLGLLCTGCRSAKRPYLTAGLTTSDGH